MLSTQLDCLGSLNKTLASKVKCHTVCLHSPLPGGNDFNSVEVMESLPYATDDAETQQVDMLAAPPVQIQPGPSQPSPDLSASERRAQYAGTRASKGSDAEVETLVEEPVLQKEVTKPAALVEPAHPEDSSEPKKTMEKDLNPFLFSPGPVFSYLILIASPPPSLPRPARAKLAGGSSLRFRSAGGPAEPERIEEKEE